MTYTPFGTPTPETLDGQKKLVAEKLMVWEIKPHPNTSMNEPCIWEGKTALMTVFGWNPQSERKWWDEIWEKMDRKTIIEYKSNLDDLLVLENVSLSNSIEWKYHTAKPEVCWQALIKTLEAK